MSTPVSIGPFCGANAHAAHDGDLVACLRDELTRYQTRFGVAASGALCCSTQVETLRTAFPQLHVEGRPAFLPGVAYLTRFATR